MNRSKADGSRPVLGRDPFLKAPSPPAPAQVAPAPPKPAAPPPPAEPELHRKSSPPARPAAKHPPQPRRRRPRPRPPEHPEPIPAAPAVQEVDRVELIEPAQAGAETAGAVKKAAGWLSPLTFGRQLGKVRLALHAEEVDPFGLDPLFWERLKPLAEFLFERYFRVELEGLDNLPAKGRVLVVANHSGTLPYDGAMLKYAIEERHPARRAARFLVEDFVFHFPFLGVLINRIGGVRACQENAERLLDQEQVVIVFPEGIKGIGKLYRERYRLQRFGRGGFVKLALRTGSPLLPVAVVGAEEIHPLLARLEWLARPLGLPYLPVTPTFPWLGPLGAVPLPSKWKIRFGKPLELPRAPEQAEQPLLVMETAEKVRSAIQGMIDEMLSARTAVFGAGF